MAYTIMPNHVHAVIGFRQSNQTINSIVANGKRFMAYGLVKLLKQQRQDKILLQLQQLVNKTDKQKGKKHEVFEPSFDRKECTSNAFLLQKLNYIHFNSCKAGLSNLPEEYEHSSATYYTSQQQGKYLITDYRDVIETDLTKQP